MATPVKVTVTGAAGQIGYALLFRIASGQLLGPDVPVRLSLLEIAPALQGGRGHRDGDRRLRVSAASPASTSPTTPRRPSTAPTSRCWSAPGPAPRVWSAAICCRPTAGSSVRRARRSTTVPRRDIKVLVVGNPANTNALIAQQHAPDVPADRFTAMTRLDHNRALGQLAAKLSVPVDRDRADDHLGQPLRHPVPRPLHGAGRRQVRRLPGRRRLAARHLHPDRRQARRRHHRGARLVFGGLGR